MDSYCTGDPAVNTPTAVSPDGDISAQIGWQGSLTCAGGYELVADSGSLDVTCVEKNAAGGQWTAALGSCRGQPYLTLIYFKNHFIIYNFQNFFLKLN